MATALEEIGAPEIGESFAVNRQYSSSGDNRTITRRYKMRLADRDTYLVPLINPTLYDALFPNAVIVDQAIRAIPGNDTDAHLIRSFAEIPTEWDEPTDRVMPMPAVSSSAFFAPSEFPFRGSQISFRTDIRINRKYFLADPKAVPRIPLFNVLDSSGLVTSAITDYTTPSVDEWIAMVAGRREFVADCRVVQWRGWIHCRETTYAVAK